jgi:membrane protease YdiL (CAAX protease family)
MDMLGMQSPIFIAIYALFIVLILPFLDLFKMLQLKKHTSSLARLAVYRFLIIMLWSATAISTVLAYPISLFTTPVSNQDFSWLFTNPWAHGLAIFVIGGFFILTFVTSLRCAFRKDVRLKIAPIFRKMRFILPVSQNERICWILISITAGVCEEMIYRGFLLEFLRGNIVGGLHLDLLIALFASSLAFGTGHLYQGLSGIITGTIGGLMFGMLAILCGGLVLPIIAHILFDLRILWMYRPGIDTPEDASRLISGWNDGSLVAT